MRLNNSETYSCRRAGDKVTTCTTSAQKAASTTKQRGPSASGLSCNSCFRPARAKYNPHLPRDFPQAMGQRPRKVQGASHAGEPSAHNSVCQLLRKRTRISANVQSDGLPSAASDGGEASERRLAERIHR